MTHPRKPFRYMHLLNSTRVKISIGVQKMKWYKLENTPCRRKKTQQILFCVTFVGDTNTLPLSQTWRLLINVNMVIFVTKLETSARYDFLKRHSWICIHVVRRLEQYLSYSMFSMTQWFQWVRVFIQRPISIYVSRFRSTKVEKQYRAKRREKTVVFLIQYGCWS